MKMSLVETPEYDIVSSGIDWITAFNAENFNKVMVSEYMSGLLDEAKSRGHHIARQVRMGYVGQGTDGAFHGWNDHNTLSILSGDLAREFGHGLNKLTQKASRIDLQVTVDTSAERPCLSRDLYYFATLSKRERGRPREYKLTCTHPQGDTLNVCKRTSDAYARLYDWGAAHKTGEKHRYWRFEIEAKRDYCRSLSYLLRHQDRDSAIAETVVFEWFKARLSSPPFKPRRFSGTPDEAPIPLRPGLIAWFEDSVSVSVARAVKEFGLERVLQSLRLDERVDIKPERSTDHHAS